MPGVSTPQINLPRIVGGPGDRGVVVNQSLQPLKASGHTTALVPGVFLFSNTGLEVWNTGDASAAYVVKSIFDQYGNMLPSQYISVADLNAGSSAKVSVMNIGGIRFEITEDALTTQLADTDVGKHGNIIVTAITSGQTSFVDNPIGVGVDSTWYLDSSATPGGLSGAKMWLIDSLSNSAGNPGPAASGVKRNWVVTCGTATYSQS